MRAAGEGLTTTAAVWVTAALGISCALASWPLNAFGAPLNLLVLPRKAARPLGKEFDEDDGGE